MSNYPDSVNPDDPRAPWNAPTADEPAPEPPGPQYSQYERLVRERDEALARAATQDELDSMYAAYVVAAVNIETVLDSHDLSLPVRHDLAIALTNCERIQQTLLAIKRRQKA